MRGKHATKPIEEVIAEAQQLAADGVRELIIVAQDTTYYGMDLYGETRLAELLRQLETVQGIEWIRLMYFYPMYITDELIDVIAGSRKIVPYLDMPLQHINDTMLRRMSRRVTRKETEEILTKLRTRIPRLTMRTTFITGFPGETEEQFAELEQFVAEQKFERSGVFTYSFEPDTPAASLPDQLPEEVKEERRGRLMEIQQQATFDWNEAQLGTRRDVIMDSQVEGEDNVWIGRSHADAPDVDALVFVTGNGRKLSPGSIVSCEIVASQEYDLCGVAVGRPK
jgi:ribosomal protein S12 methylthiotransferase